MPRMSISRLSGERGDAARGGHGEPGLAARLRRDGYAFPVDVMAPAEAAAIRARIEALEAGPVGRGPEAQRLYRFKPYLIFAWAAELVRHPALLDAVQAVIGPDILVWALGLFIKEPRDATVIKWHQDGYHMDISDNGRAVRAWLALAETTADNGTMRFIGGSHAGGFQPHDEDDSARHYALRGEHIAAPPGEARAVPVCLAPGQMSLHHLATVHGSPGNATDARRVNVAMTFVAPEVRPLGGRDTATLVRGVDRYRHWVAEPALPAAEFDRDCLAEHRRSMAIRHAAYHGKALPDS